MSRRRCHLAVGMVATLGLGPVVAVGAGPASATPSRTVVHHVRPVDATGHLKPGYAVVRRLGHAQCAAGSEATGSAYRCFTGNYVVDPCWVTAQHQYVDCLPDGWSHRVWRLHVTEGYDNTDFTTTSDRGSLPWGIQLVSGSRWAFLQGASGNVGDQRINYGRAGSSSVLIGNAHRSTAVWRIAKARDTGDYRYTRDGSVEIAVAWYGLASLRG